MGHPAVTGLAAISAPGLSTSGARAAARASGFTLIELLVVLLLLAVLVGVATLNLRGREAGDVREEARRLAALLLTAQQEAVLQGQVLALALSAEGYEFLRLDQAGALKAVTGDTLLRTRELSAGVRISTVEIDGSPQTEGARIILWPTGELAPFVITLVKGDIRWQVTGSTADGIRPVLLGATRASAQG